MNSLKKFIPRSVAVSIAPVSDRIIDFACTIGLVQDPQQMTVGDTTARYRVTSASERWRVQQYMGEKDIIEGIVSEVRSDDCFWDVGAAVGTYSCIVANAGATVVAFEPHEGNYKRCLENTRLNGISIITKQLALSDTAGQLKLKEDRTVGSGMHQVSEEGALEISTVRGDEVDVPDPTIIKIDVEGHELKVLEGLGDRLDTVRKIYIECHPGLGVTKEAVTQQLTARGFSATIHKIDRSEPYLIGTK